jgi:D-amino peptidase
LGEVETVTVKEGVSRSAAACVPVPKAHEMIEEAAARGVQRASDFKPFVFGGPVTAEVVFTDPSYADTLEQLDFVTRVEGRTIRLESEDFLKAFERFNALHFLAPVVR